MTPRRMYSLALVLMLAVSFAGCSGRPAVGKVKGTVTLDGKPLPRGSITFETTGQRPAMGTIENGEIIAVTLYDPGDGAVVGPNKVGIVSTDEVYGPSGIPNPGEKEPPKAKMIVYSSAVPKQYNDPGTSQLTVDIKKGENVVEFKLVSK
ncbi:hypothetical protein [Fimbriiglobus ruber]|uniref:Lipoprotein n=1 Tax=Fimbriiglobus ruber TaxID=1908690 RepID=A0A225E0W0_9BACT|nr:hypothetical protein [Fimbriiglobus ruber]OWK46803.1 hypothetical protein FRUB_00502 [Fimbriiglobus ruber]